MVRLRPIPLLPKALPILCFNPTMVRLRPERVRQLLRRAEAVSIPLWCDCDRTEGWALHCPFSVSIPLWCDCDIQLTEAYERYAKRFNPTMVRLRPGGSKVVTIDKRVSIPLWCDCDAFAERVVPLVERFQSHYGAIATKGILSC